MKVKLLVFTLKLMTLLDGSPILLHMFPLERYILSLVLFGSQGQVKLTVFISALSVHYFMNHLHNNFQTWYSCCQLESDNSLYICIPFEFCTGKGRGIFMFLYIKIIPPFIAALCVVTTADKTSTKDFKKISFLISNDNF